MDRITASGEAGRVTTETAAPVGSGQGAANAATPDPASGTDRSPLQGLSLADASATLGAGRNLVADYVIDADNRLAEIRLIDPTTHQVVAASPPDTIMQMQQEMRAYQSAAGQLKAAGISSTQPSSGISSTQPS